MHTWRVWQNNRIAGYVTSASEYGAYLRATDKYGKYIWVERITYDCLA